MATFTEQSHLDMPTPGWLHVNGVSLSTDVQQQSFSTFDHRIKQITSPIPIDSMPFTATINDRQYHKLENTDLPKKLFIDRQIKKVKSLPGLIKGTALSHQSLLHSAPHKNDQETEHNNNNNNNDDESSPMHHNYERTNEIRRPRVSFSEFNKVQFFEDSNDTSQQITHRRYRHRSTKKSTNMIKNNNPVSPPSIQQSQTLYAPYRSLSRQQQQQPNGNELSIRKQHLIPSPRVHSSRITHLPDILNQSLPMENSIQEKYNLQREKSLFQFPEPAAEVSINSSTEISRESTRAGGIRPTDYYEQNDAGINTLLNSSSISSSLTSRHRPTLRTISLRQQFTSQIRSKSTHFSNNNNNNNNQIITTNPRRSASSKHGIIRNHSIDDEHDDIHNHNLLSTLDNRPMTGLSSSKHLKRNYIIHFNSKNPFNGNTTIDSNETNRHHMKKNIHELSNERFQNVLKIVRPPYITSTTHSSHPDTTLQSDAPPPPTTTATNHMNGTMRSSRTTSGYGSREYQLTSNTIFV